jgi:serine/threonine protein kinase
MEHVDGTSLWQLLRDNNKKGELIPVDKAVSILKNILSGISYAHSKGICHRDVSPMNILVTKWGNPKISDFGIARVLSTENIDDSPQGGTGHPYFMSPEQARGEPRISRTYSWLVLRGLFLQ